MLSLLNKLFRKIPLKLRWPAFVVLGFASAGSFITSTSYFGDKTHTNALFTILGIVLALITIGIGWVANSENKDKK